MINENIDNVQVENNSENLSSQETSIENSQPELPIEQSTDEQANTETGNAEQKTNDVPPELEDKYKSMQRDYTEKTTKLATERRDWETRLKAAEEKAKIYDLINSNPDASQAVLKAFNVVKDEPKPQEPTEDEIVSRYGNIEVYNEIKELKNKISSYENKLNSIDTETNVQKAERVIEEYQSKPENADFGNLHAMGLIEPLIVQIRAQYPNATDTQVLQEAHNQARSRYTAIGQSIMKSEHEKNKKMLETKKNANMDRGGSAAGTNPTSLKEFKDIYFEEVKKHGIPL